ncbi:MAG: GlsB/YeaQ/YmgE family stress response membrane protein [Alphaproteobacteria bacterium]|nr:GlsB/YeaQ/YmgE family stress response membrane protein [Alphaproteobacteria bacterium]
MGIIGTIIVGLIVGVIAKLFVHGPGEPQGFVLTAIVGIAGSLLASWVGQAIGWYQPGQAAGWIMSIIGAVVVMVIWGAIVKRSA